jgi:hypothetical protein
VNQIAKAYRNLLEQCYTARDQYPESDLCIFSMGVGKRYNGKLLVIGRATNGWGYRFAKDDPNDRLRVSESFIAAIDSGNLDWVSQQWGATAGYNSKKSQFWRVSRMLANRIANHSDDCIDHICWTNLYKIAPPDGGNPSGRLMRVQFERCAQILGSEITFSKPQNTIFLTGYGWAKPFLDSLNVSNQLESADYKFVQFASRMGGVNYVVGQHPQGKPEQPHCAEIINALEFLISGCELT